MVTWRLYLFSMAAFVVPLSGFWLHLWQVGGGLKWLEPEPDLLAIMAISIAVSAFLATFGVEMPTRA